MPKNQKQFPSDADAVGNPDARIPCLQILEQIDAFIYVADMETYELLYVNSRIRKVFGNNLVGKTCWRVLQKDQTGPCTFCTNHLLVNRDGRPNDVYCWEFENTRIGKWFQLRDQAIYWNKDRLVRMEIATDITEHRRNRNVAGALHRLARALWKTRDLNQYYARVHQVFKQFIGADNFFVALADRENDKVVFPYFVDEKDGNFFEIYGLSSPNQNSLTLSVIRSGRPLFIRKEESEARYASGEFNRIGTTAEIWLGVPLRIQGEVIGALGVQSYDNPHAFSRKEETLLVSVSELIAVAIERSRTDIALQESEARHRALSEATFEAIFISDKGICIDANSAASEMFGYSREELIGIVGTDAVAPEDRELVFQKMMSGCEASYEAGALRKDGTVFPAEFRGKMFSFKGKAIRGTAVRDLTNRKAVENRMRDSLDTLESLFRASPVGMGIARNRVLEKVNDRLCVITGYEREDLLGQKTRMVYPDDEEYRRVGRKLYAAIREKGIAMMDTRWRRKDGSLMDILLGSSALDLRDPSKGISFFAIDFTERKVLEAQLRQAQKMEAVGQLAGGVAHDFNNLLQVIIGFTEIALDQARPDGPNPPVLHQIMQAGKRARELVRQLLAFSRRQVMAMKILDLNRLIRNHLKMIRRVIGEHIDLIFVPMTEPGTVMADAGQIEQAVMNLCVNARDAMPAGGSLTIGIETCDSLPETHGNQRSGGQDKFVMLRFSDTGTGMDAETLGQIFEPFFTTKEVGKGSGLGLSTVFGIVKQHNGVIQARSRPNEGSVFEIILPFADSRDSDAPVLQTPEESVGGKETILVAEDDEMVRELVTSILEKAGYRVLCGHDGPSTLELFHAHADTVELALLDVIMPGMSGKEVCDEILQIKPECRILFSSGYNTDAVHTNFILDQGMELLQKPYSRDTLLRKIRASLEREDSYER